MKGKKCEHHRSEDYQTKKGWRRVEIYVALWDKLSQLGYSSAPFYAEYKKVDQNKDETTERKNIYFTKARETFQKMNKIMSLMKPIGSQQKSQVKAIDADVSSFKENVKS